jgi:aspartate-semialdehyde dehydrogenase
MASLRLFASARSAGKTMVCTGKTYTVEEAKLGGFAGVDVAFFAAGGAVTRALAPDAVKSGCLVIDKSAHYRMDPDVPLCVPEVNLEAARAPAKGIVANPNCSTIQMLVALAPIHRRNPIRRIVVSTYQAISGAGQAAVEHFMAQASAFAAGASMPEGPLSRQLAGSLTMEWTRDASSGYQEEELKMVHETRKILDSPSLRVSPTAVRVPVVNGHAESIALECERPISAAEARALLADAPGVRLVDDFAAGVYPTPLDASGTDDVLVGRVRDDLGLPGGILLWVVGDNLRKGAATNAVQIAEGLMLP